MRDLLLAPLLVERHVRIRPAEVAVELGDLVLEHEVIAEAVVGEVRDQPVVLVPVFAIVREHEVGPDLALQLLEEFLDRHRGVGEEAVAERLLHETPFAGHLQERARAFSRFLRPRFVPAQDHPGEPRNRQLAQEAEQSPAAADLDVVAVCSETEQLVAALRRRTEAELQHVASRPRRARSAASRAPRAPSPNCTDR